MNAPIITKPVVAYSFPPDAFHVQRVTAALFIENRRGYCLNEFGTGKTRSILFAYDALRQAGVARKMLVIAPLSALVRTWKREIDLYFRHLKCAVLHGTKDKRLKELARDVDVYIINHKGLEVVFDALVRRIEINMVTCDEAATYRNGRANMTKALREYVRDIEYVWGLTGSPIPRAVTDVWGPCSCITPWSVPKYFTIFRDQLMVKAPYSQFQWKPKPGAEERAVACMQPSVRFSLDDVVELPPRVINYYEAELTEKQLFAYESMRKVMVAMAEDKRIDALNAGAALSKLLQIAIGYVYTRAGDIVELDNKPRQQLILDLIDSTAQKVILFAPFKSAVSAFGKMLAHNDVPYATVTGDTTISRRNVIFTEFQDTPKYKTLLAHPVCMSHSLTLTKAATTIWAGPVTSLETFTQANGRTYRVGQEHRTLVAMIGGTPMEKRMYQLLGRNEQLQNQFLALMSMITSNSEGN